MYDVVVIGGGAAGVFAAITAKEAKPQANVLLLEKSAVLLSKVKVSGGGRCNVTHHCFDPRELIKNYPRGSKELLGPFHRFGPKNTIEWFLKRKVLLKAEADGRMFPTTDSSETIINCLKEEMEKLKVDIRYKSGITSINRVDKGFLLKIKSGETLMTQAIILASGSSSEGYELATMLGHTIQLPVPSLFTFNVPDFSLKELSGVALPKVSLSLEGTAFQQTGPLLITHFGFSGPAALKLSAFAARYLHEKQYEVTLTLHWLDDKEFEAIMSCLTACKQQHPQKYLVSENLFNLPKNLWKFFLDSLGDRSQKKLKDLSIKDLKELAHKLYRDPYKVKGKTTNKEEFVTCGGVTLKEVDFKTMKSKVCEGLYFAGEVLDIDGVTGGFNFQNAWTTGYFAGRASVEVID